MVPINKKIIPNLVNSNIEKGAKFILEYSSSWLRFSIIELTTRFVDVPINVSVPPKIAA